MEKNFTDWHALKETVNNQTSSSGSGYKARDIWWISLGHNIGFEEDGKGERFSRPVLVVKGFSPSVFWGVPLTSVERDETHYYYPFTVQMSDGSTRLNTALLSQMRVFDTKRMTTKLGIAGIDDFKKIKEKLVALLA